MARYLLEVAYKGTHYAGFQRQQNAHTIQQVLEDALRIFYKRDLALTGSSRTDAGVHARQNFFHTDAEDLLITSHHLYNLNALLPQDVVVKTVRAIPHHFHCRFQALYRCYHYHLHSEKDPFLTDRSWFYPYPLDLEKLNAAASLLLRYEDFTSFSKRNTQAKTRLCNITASMWQRQAGGWLYEVQANRFLRGMVRGLVGTMLLHGRGKISLREFEDILLAKDCTKADFSTPPHGLCLMEVGLPELH
jgi:tRNA pseudouridine38-40 synthase